MLDSNLKPIEIGQRVSVVYKDRRIVGNPDVLGFGIVIKINGDKSVTVYTDSEQQVTIFRSNKAFDRGVGAITYKIAIIDMNLFQ